MFFESIWGGLKGFNLWLREGVYFRYFKLLYLNYFYELFEMERKFQILVIKC